MAVCANILVQNNFKRDRLSHIQRLDTTVETMLFFYVIFFATYIGGSEAAKVKYAGYEPVTVVADHVSDVVKTVRVQRNRERLSHRHVRQTLIRQGLQETKP